MIRIFIPLPITSRIAAGHVSLSATALSVCARRCSLSLSPSLFRPWADESKRARLFLLGAQRSQLLLFQRHVSASRGRRKKFFERKMIAPRFGWGLSAGISCREKSSFRYESRPWFCVIGPRIQLIGRTWTWKVRREGREEGKKGMERDLFFSSVREFWFY